MTAAKLKKGILAVLKYFTLILGAFVSILPLVVCVITAFKSPEEYASTNVMTLPKSWTYVENFIQAWKQANMGVAFRNSFIILVFVLAGSILTGSMIAYVLSRFKFKGNGLIRSLFPFCIPASWYCHAGIRISDHVHHWMDQLPSWIHHNDVRNRYYIYLHIYPVL